MSDGVDTNPPKTRTLSWLSIVKRAIGDAWHEKETVYEFSNGRKFKDSGESGAFYEPD